jgi:hypothetical protein
MQVMSRRGYTAHEKRKKDVTMTQSHLTGTLVSDTGPMEQVQPLAPSAPALRVVLRSSFVDVAGAQFQTALDEAGCTVQPIQINHPRNQERVYLFASRECLREIRVWGAFALGCGLVIGFVVES